MKQDQTIFPENFPALSTDEAFDFYESVRGRLPIATFKNSAKAVANLGELEDEFDVFVFDAYGVLNKGLEAVPGAAHRIAALQAAGKKAFVLTNGASFPAQKSQDKFNRLNMSFTLDEIVPSRTAAERALLDHSEVQHWGVISGYPLEPSDLPVPFTIVADDLAAYNKVDGILFLSAIGFTPQKYQCLQKAMAQNPRPLIVANPDVVAPQQGFFSLEPGFHSHTLADELGIEPEFQGKPFSAIYDIVVQRLPTPVAPHRIAMMGDTLHTDILGGAAMGWRTVLVTDHGLFEGKDVRHYIEKSGIIPDFIVPNI
ncbi:MAG: HAD hydrolase-like protein [Hyphomicrobiales bacterium]